MYTRLTTEGRSVGKTVLKLGFWVGIFVLGLAALATARDKIAETFATPQAEPRAVARIPPPAMAVSETPREVPKDEAWPEPDAPPAVTYVAPGAPAVGPSGGGEVVRQREWHWPQAHGDGPRKKAAAEQRPPESAPARRHEKAKVPPPAPKQSAPKVKSHSKVPPPRPAPPKRQPPPPRPPSHHRH